MTRVERIEQEIVELSSAERQDLRIWFAELDAAEWDRQIEADAVGGGLRALSDAAIAEHRAGTTTRL